MECELPLDSRKKLLLEFGSLLFHCYLKQCFDLQNNNYHGPKIFDSIFNLLTLRTNKNSDDFSFNLYLQFRTHVVATIQDKTIIKFHILYKVYCFFYIANKMITQNLQHSMTTDNL